MAKTSTKRVAGGGSPLHKLVAERVTKLKGDMRQEEFAQLCGLGSRTVGRLLRGEGSPMLETLEAVAKAKNVPIDSLIARQDQPTAKGSLDARLKSLRSEALQQYVLTALSVAESMQERLPDGLLVMLKSPTSANYAEFEQKLAALADEINNKNKPIKCSA